MRFIHLAAALAALVGLAGAAHAADEDVRCLLASNLFVKAEQDPAKRQVAMMAAYFYLGRADGRLSAVQLVTALKAEALALNATNAGPTMTACAKRVQSAGAAIQVMGKDLQAGK